RNTESAGEDAPAKAAADLAKMGEELTSRSGRHQEVDDEPGIERFAARGIIGAADESRINVFGLGGAQAKLAGTDLNLASDTAMVGPAETGVSHDRAIDVGEGLIENDGRGGQNHHGKHPAHAEGAVTDGDGNNGIAKFVRSRSNIE